MGERRRLGEGVAGGRVQNSVSTSSSSSVKALSRRRRRRSPSLRVEPRRSAVVPSAAIAAPSMLPAYYGKFKKERDFRLGS